MEKKTIAEEFKLKKIKPDTRLRHYNASQAVQNRLRILVKKKKGLKK